MYILARNDTIAMIIHIVTTGKNDMVIMLVIRLPTSTINVISCSVIKGYGIQPVYNYNVVIIMSCMITTIAIIFIILA